MDHLSLRPKIPEEEISERSRTNKPAIGPNPNPNPIERPVAAMEILSTTSTTSLNLSTSDSSGHSPTIRRSFGFPPGLNPRYSNPVQSDTENQTNLMNRLMALDLSSNASAGQELLPPNPRFPLPDRENTRPPAMNHNHPRNMPPQYQQYFAPQPQFGMQGMPKNNHDSSQNGWAAINQAPRSNHSMNLLPQQHYQQQQQQQQRGHRSNSRNPNSHVHENNNFVTFFIKTNKSYYKLTVTLPRQFQSSPPWMLCLQEEDRILRLFEEKGIARSLNIQEVIRIRIKTRQQIICFYDLMKSIFEKTEVRISSYNHKMPVPNFRPNMLVYFGIESRKERLLVNSIMMQCSYQVRYLSVSGL